MIKMVEQNITKLIEAISLDKIEMIVDSLNLFLYVILACFILYFLSRLIPSIINYKAMKYLEVRITTKNIKDPPVVDYLKKKIGNHKKKKEEDGSYISKKH